MDQIAFLKYQENINIVQFIITAILVKLFSFTISYDNV